MHKLFLLFTIGSSIVACQKIENPDDLLGNYENPAGTRKMEIVAKNTEYCGILTWTSDPNNEVQVGDTLLNDLHLDGNKFEGKIRYLGSEYDCKIRLKKDGIEIRAAGKKRFWSKF